MVYASKSQGGKRESAVNGWAATRVADVMWRP